MSQVRFELHPGTEEWGRRNDDRWRHDLADLQTRFERALPAETVQPEPGVGTRGLAELNEVILTLGSAGAITAAVELVKMWVGSKPGLRSVTVTVKDDGGGAEYRVQGDGLGADEVARVAIAALGADAEGGTTQVGTTDG